MPGPGELTRIMPRSENNATSAYKEKQWGKDLEGEFIIDGYSYKGKRAFGKALEGLKTLMKKGVNGEINKTKFKVLDNRKNRAGIDIEIELKENNTRGIAVLKLYGPSIKKQNVVMVTKL